MRTSSMRFRRPFAIAVALWAAGAAAGEWTSQAQADQIKLPVTADVGICAHPAERSLNTGASSRVRIKGNDHYYLFDFDCAKIAAWRIERAALHVKLAGGHLHACAAATVPIAWTEGKSAGKPEDGAPCFTHVRYPKDAWDPYGQAPRGGTILDATFNNPLMAWRAAPVTYEGQWAVIELAPELVQAVAMGLSHGLLLAEDKGQTFENHDIFTREQSNAQPYVTVEGAPVHVAATLALARPAPKAEPWPQAADFKTGAIRVDLATTGATQPWGHRVRVKETGQELGVLGEPTVVIEGLKPDTQYTLVVESFTGPQGSSAQVQARSSPAPAMPVAPNLKPPDSIGARIVGAGGWLAELHAPTEKLAPDAKPLAKDKGFAVPVTPTGAWVGLQVAIWAPNPTAELSVKVSPLVHTGDESKPVAPLKHVSLYRVWYVSKDNQPQAEALVPLQAGATLKPWPGKSAQAHHTFFVDIWAPSAATAGPYEGKLDVTSGGATVLSIPLKLTVAPVALADPWTGLASYGGTEIVGDMNTYGSPAGALGKKESDRKAFLDAELKYYRLAQAHRMTLNALHYSHSGNVDWAGAPKIAGRGKDTRVTDWSDWDARYGPLLTGSAFAPATGYVGPGAGQPIHHQYLPINENWPAPLVEHFKPWPPPKDYQQFLMWTVDLPPIAKCFDTEYAAAWTAIVNQFELHAKELNGGGTALQVYLNDKCMYRDPKHGGRGITLWTLDEPMFADDFIALAYFGRLFRSAYATPQTFAHRSLQFRIDISRPTHQRDWLDGVVDLNVVADDLYSQRRLIARRKELLGERYWNYHMPASFGADNVPWAAWPIQSCCWGATGTLPWQTVGSDGDLDSADATALMYPGTRFGLDEPMPSLRMKAWRDGLQDAQLLCELRQRNRWTDLQLRAWVAQACGLSGADKVDPPSDSPIVTFAGVTAGQLDALRRAALAALGGSATAASRS